jgi:hypothetical protein
LGDCRAARAASPEAKDALLISIQTGMLVALGFLIASLVWLLLASAFWSRAVRLTTQRLKRSMPVSESEIKADRDRLRAEQAIKVHKLETRLEQAKLNRARHLIEINRRDASISALETDIVTIRTDLEEHQNARRVLEQTVADRLPKVEARLAEAKRLLFNRDREIADLTQSAKRHKLALEEASSINAQKAAQIDRLNTALTTRGARARRAPSEAGAEGEVALRAEAESLRTKTREQAALIDRLQRRLGQGYVVPGPVAMVPAPDADDAGIDRARENLSEAEATLNAVRSPPPAAPAPDTSRPEQEREIRALKARVEDQAGEIARLKAALAAFEQADGGSGLKNSKLALKARAGSAEAQAERQASTIGRLRAELAAANERLARQAAHYMDEMRRIGGGTGSSSGQGRNAARDTERRKLVERVAQVRPALVTENSRPAALPSTVETANGAENAAGNGHDPKPETAPAAEKLAAPEPAAATPAAEMPQTAAIPEERRKLRLLDRITSLAKT